MSSVNKVILIGNVGNDPELRAFSSGDEVAHLSIATSESWKDKKTGEKKEKTEWHRVVVFNKGLIGLIKNYVKKGTKLYLEGCLQTRKWNDASTGQDKYTTEIVLKQFGGQITLLSSNGSNSQSSSNNSNGDNTSPVNEAQDLDDEIPF